MNFRCKFRHCRSIPLLRFPVRVLNFGNLATFSVDFCILYAIFLLPDIAYLPADTSRDLVTLTFDLLTLNSWRTGGLRDQPCHQVWRPYAYPFLSYNVSRWLPLRMRMWLCVHCTCAESRDPWVGGQNQWHFWNPRSRFAYSIYNFYWAPTTIKGRLLSSRPMLKQFSGEKNSKSRQMGPQNDVFRGKWGSKP